MTAPLKRTSSFFATFCHCDNVYEAKRFANLPDNESSFAFAILSIENLANYNHKEPRSSACSNDKVWSYFQKKKEATQETNN
jgi:hypothetical protein